MSATLIITAAIALIIGMSCGMFLGTWWWARSPHHDGDGDEGSRG